MLGRKAATGAAAYSLRPARASTLLALRPQRSGHSRWARSLDTPLDTHSPTSTMCVCACLLPSESQKA